MVVQGNKPLSVNTGIIIRNRSQYNERDMATDPDPTFLFAFT